jgi:hypothetical protein
MRLINFDITEKVMRIPFLPSWPCRGIANTGEKSAGEGLAGRFHGLAAKAVKSIFNNP